MRAMANQRIPPIFDEHAFARFLLAGTYALIGPTFATP